MLIRKLEYIILNFFNFMVVKKSKKSTKDSANGGCGDKDLTGVTFMNCTRVHGVVFREWVVGVRCGRQGHGDSSKSFIGKWFAVMSNIIKNRLVEIAGF
jgi:hypothetical protein